MTDVLLDCARQYVKSKGQSWSDRTADSRAPYASSPPPDADAGEGG